MDKTKTYREKVLEEFDEEFPERNNIDGDLAFYPCMNFKTFLDKKLEEQEKNNLEFVRLKIESIKWLKNKIDEQKQIHAVEIKRLSKDANEWQKDYIELEKRLRLSEFDILKVLWLNSTDAKGMLLQMDRECRVNIAKLILALQDKKVMIPKEPRGHRRMG